MTECGVHYMAPHSLIPGGSRLFKGLIRFYRCFLTILDAFSSLHMGIEMEKTVYELLHRELESSIPIC